MAIAYPHIYAELVIYFIGTGSDNAKAETIIRGNIAPFVRRLKISFPYDRKLVRDTFSKWTRHSDIKLLSCVMDVCTGIEHLQLDNLQLSGAAGTTGASDPVDPRLGQLQSLEVLYGVTPTFCELSIVLTRATSLVHLSIAELKKDSEFDVPAECTLVNLETLILDGSRGYVMSVVKWAAGRAISLHTLTLSGRSWCRGGVDLLPLDPTLRHLIIWDEDDTFSAGRSRFHQPEKRLFNDLCTVTVNSIRCLRTGPNLQLLTIRTYVHDARPACSVDGLINQVLKDSHSVKCVTINFYHDPNIKHLEYLISALAKIWRESTVMLKINVKGESPRLALQLLMRKELREADSLGRLRFEDKDTAPKESILFYSESLLDY